MTEENQTTPVNIEHKQSKEEVENKLTYKQLKEEVEKKSKSTVTDVIAKLKETIFKNKTGEYSSKMCYIDEFEVIDSLCKGDEYEEAKKKIILFLKMYVEDMNPTHIKIPALIFCLKI